MQSLPCIGKKLKKTLQVKCYYKVSWSLLEVSVWSTFSTCIFVKINQTLCRASTWTETAILESAVNPNPTLEKITGETSAMVHIPHCWHVYSWQNFTSFDMSTKSTSPYNNNYRYFCVVFTSHETIYRPTSLMISGATWASRGPRLTKS